MRYLLATAATAALLAFALPAAAAEDYVMLKVNKVDVPKSEVEAMWAGLFPPGAAPELDQVKPEMRDKILRGVMTEKLLLAEARKQNIDQSPEVIKQLEDLKKKLVVKTFLDQKTSDMISEADLRREYDAMVKSMRDEKEMRARHILVATQEEAKDVKAKLADGKNFDALAKQYSKDPGSAQQGGDLGYFTADKMVKEFADAAFTLKKGEVSDPVKTGFGWHIIKVEDVRKMTVPTFNQAKDTLRARLQDKKLGEYIRGLVKDADVTLYDAKGKEVAFTKEVKDAN